MGQIVVGVDGSASSLAALAWAIDEAKARQATVLAVHAWLAYSQVSPLESMSPVFLPGEGENIAGDILAEAVRKVVGDSAGDVVIEQRVIGGHPASALIDSSHDADMLVVGSRGHGGFLGLLLGSVSNQCVHHALCPVVVVRDQDQDEGK